MIHGSILAERFRPACRVSYRHQLSRDLVSPPRLAGSARASAPFTIGQQAADGRPCSGTSGCHGAIAGAHLCAVIAIRGLRCSHSHPESALLEPALLASFLRASGLEGIAPSVSSYMTLGTKWGARRLPDGRGWSDYRQIIEQFLPPGALELAVTDLDTFLQVELPALQQWRVTAEDARRIHHRPGGDRHRTAPMFRESHDLIRQWLPQAEELVVPQATHALSRISIPAR